MTRMTRIGGGSTLLLILMAMFVPTAYVPMKASLLVLACSVAIMGVLLGVFRINRASFSAICALTLVGLLYSLYGGLYGAPGAMRVLSVYFLWPWVYLLLAVYLSHERSLELLWKTLLASLLMTVVYSFWFLGMQAGVIPEYLYVVLDQGQAVGFYDGFVEYNLYSIASLLFLIPMAIHVWYIQLKRHRWKHMYLWGSLIVASIVLTFLTGRRALLLAVMISPMIILGEWWWLSGRKQVTIRHRQLAKRPGAYLLAVCVVFFVVFFAVLLLAYVKVDLHTIGARFADGFNFASGESTSERSAQYIALMNGWFDSSILFGAGNGATVAVVRSFEMSWAYELTYVYLLYSTGLVGVVFYFGWFGYGLLRIRRSLKRRPDLTMYVLPMMTGVFSLGIAAASNPYIGKFDYLWIIMLPHLLAGGLKYQRVAG